MEKQKYSKTSLNKYSKYDVETSKRKMPVNLHKKMLRERRQRNKVKKKSKKYFRRTKKDFKDHEHEALVNSTFKELKSILAENDVLSDIPFDITPEELLGEIALAEGNGMIVYVQRDGLQDLTVILPQENPTIANLKRAIETTANTQLKRELQQRHAERLKRRAREEKIYSTDTEVASSSSRSESADKKTETKSQTKKSIVGISVKSQTRNTGELVCSTTRNGHQHRANVSWRFLWRAYMLYHMETNKIIDDSNGRRLLSQCGIENATTLKFCKRENYCGRKRQ